MRTFLLSWHTKNTFKATTKGNLRQRYSQGKTVLLNSVQEFIEMQYWLLLTFCICLHNQLSSIHSILHVNKECRCLNKIFHQIDRKWMVAPLTNFYGKSWVGFVLTQENALSWRFHFIAKRKSMNSSKKRY